MSHLEEISAGSGGHSKTFTVSAFASVLNSCLIIHFRAIIGYRSGLLQSQIGLSGAISVKYNKLKLLNRLSNHSTPSDQIYSTGLKIETLL